MSQELSVTIKATFAKSGVTEKIAPGAVAIDVAGSRMIHNVQAVGTNAELLLLGDVAPGWIVGVNRDSSNYVDFSPDGTNFLIRAKAGETFAFRSVSTTTIYAKANTGSCNVEFWAIDA